MKPTAAKLASDFSGYGNEVLYRMCREQPKHTDRDVIASKVWLIGRAYSASIERKAPVVKGEDFYLTKVASAILDSDLDEWITSVSEIDRLTHNNLALSLNCHKKLTDLFATVTKLENRSLASKYLHFHVPRAFFIYDSIANTRVRQKVRGKRSRFDCPRGFDREYAAFSIRCLFYRDEFLERELDELVTPRRLDMELMDYGRYFLTKKSPTAKFLRSLP